MALNYPGPYQLRIYYTVGPGAAPDLLHVCQLNVDPVSAPDLGDAFADIDIKARTAAARDLETIVDEFVALLVPIFYSGDSLFTHAELWKVDALSFDMTYVSTYAINEAGTDADPAVPASQTILTFRTYEGGIMKISLQETTIGSGASQAIVVGAGEINAIAAYCTADADSFFLARDTSYPFIGLEMHPGQGEAIFKKRYR